MINYELKPTFYNLKKSLLNDSVGRNGSIADFIKFLDEETEGNIAIALNDSWGNGKTFFVNQLQMVLQSYGSSDPNLADVKNFMAKYLKNYPVKHYIPVYYDAWSNDNDNDPVLSIIFQMLQNISDLKQYDITDRDWYSIIADGLDVVSMAFGCPRLNQLFADIKGKNPFEEIKKIKEVDKALSDIFDALLEKFPEDTRIIFFIDELDRCCPDFSVRLLERIKHHFLHEKVIFVLTINTLELQNTIKRHYGNDFNADKYLHRFFDILIPLPAANIKKYCQLMHLDESGARNDVAISVIQKYNFSLREINRYLQYLKLAFPRDCVNEPKNIFYFNVLVPFLIGLKIHSLKKYNAFINGEDSTEFVKIMQDCRPDIRCDVLLGADETFDVSLEDTQKLVSLPDKFKSVYECLFAANGKRALPIYRGVICSDDKKKILETISLINAI